MRKAILKQFGALYKKTDDIPGGTKTKIILTCFIVIILISLSSFHEESLDSWLSAVSDMVMASCAFAALLKVNSYFSSYAAKDAYDAAKKIKYEIFPRILAANSINYICLEIRRKLDVPRQYPEKVKIEDVTEKVNELNAALTQEKNNLAQNVFELQNQNKIITDSLRHLENTSLKEYKDIHQQGMFVWRLTTALNMHLTYTLNDIPSGDFDYTLVFKQIDDVLDASSLLLNKINEELNK
ncbi:hypothetical protein [Klebsiella michiganensis]|uniref:hypothetical protein n=1 Tax=Klebsiella michiganensis TaxID=1134687 RepID=UPI0015A5BAE4|nr:hypothetical protein [Klebsiella michiganensis]